MSATRSNVLGLYKTMLRESQLFNNYNFRNYAIRRIRDAFKANKNLHDCDAIEAAYNEAFTTLAIIKRQVVVSDLYKSDKLVIENLKQLVFWLDSNVTYDMIYFIRMLIQKG